MNLETKFGKINFDEEKTLFFPKGLIGYNSYKHFSLIQVRPKSSLLVLQNIHDPEISLVVVDPFTFLKEYEAKLSDKEQAIIQAASISQISILVTISIPNDRPDILNLNLSGPIFINHQARLAIQAVQAENKFPHKLQLQIKEKGQENMEIISTKQDFE